MSTTTQPSEPEPVEKQLCISCVAPNDPTAHFCRQCGAPLTSYAATAPFERILAEGSAYRAAVERPRKLIVVLGIWLIFGAAIVSCLAFISSFSSRSQPQDRFISLAACSPVLIFSIAMIVKTTLNYLTRTNINLEDAAPPATEVDSRQAE